MKDFYSFWGKAQSGDAEGPTFHLLVYHSLDVAAVGKVLLKEDTQLRRRLAAKTGLDESINRW